MAVDSYANNMDFKKNLIEWILGTLITNSRIFVNENQTQCFSIFHLSFSSFPAKLDLRVRFGRKTAGTYWFPLCHETLVFYFVC